MAFILSWWAMIPAEPLLERFCRYVTIDTTSDRRAPSIPTTPAQAEFARGLAWELRSLGAESVEVDEHSFVVARFASPRAEADGLPVIGFMAHMDTSSDAPGNGVNPVVHRSFDGGPITLADGLILDPAEFPELAACAGHTVITSDGTTLLGADDKGGLAAVMSAVEHLLRHPDLARPRLEVIFTPDEETGLAMPRFPFPLVSCAACYTVDGGAMGSVEAECFEAFRAKVSLTGRSIHPGTARGKLVNAVEMAADFLSLLPRAESPQATDGRFGFYFPAGATGTVENAEIEIFIRDFDEAECHRRIETLRSIASAVRASHPGGSVSVAAEKQYSNMKRGLDDRPEVLDRLLAAVRSAGLEPTITPIRGGTDGANLTENGIPTPNLFIGGGNYHSRLEWVSLTGMAKAAETLVHLAGLWARA